MRTVIQKIDTRSLKSSEEVDQRATDIYELFKERVADFKSKNPQVDLKISISGVYPYVQGFVQGNKVVGSNYDMTVWKTVPIYKCHLQNFSDGSGYYLDLAINFVQSRGSEDWRLDEEKLSEKMDDALRNAAKDFIESPVNTL